MFKTSRIERPTMEKLALTILPAAFAPILLIVMPVLTAACGALGALAVGVIFGGAFHEVLTPFGLGDVELWKVGAVLGFLSGHFRSTVTTTR